MEDRDTRIARQAHEAAICLAAEAFAALAAGKVPPSLEFSANILFVADLGLSDKPSRLLAEQGIELVGDLVRHSEDDLLVIIGFGEKSLDEVRARLAEHELTLKGSELPAPTPVQNLRFSAVVLRRFARGTFRLDGTYVPIETVEQLVRLCADDLLTIPGFGQAYLRQVEQVLARHGKSLRQ
jgi:DNA-directed RNA polymerase alpha subunit